MPGIVGLVSKMPREWAELQVQQMLDAICHQVSYEAGTFADAVAGVYVGWANRKHSFADGMPVRNERGDVILVFSGEEYPEPGTAYRLRERGHGLDTDGPSDRKSTRLNSSHLG